MKKKVHKFFRINEVFPVESRYALPAFWVMNGIVILLLLFFVHGHPIWWKYHVHNSTFICIKTVPVYHLDHEKLKRVLQRLDLLQQLNFAGVESTKAVGDTGITEKSFQHVRTILIKLMSSGYLEFPKKDLKGESYIYVLDHTQNKKQSKNKVQLLELIEKTNIEAQVAQSAAEMNSADRQIITSLVKNLIEDNLVFATSEKEIVPLKTSQTRLYDIISAVVSTILVSFIFLWIFCYYGCMVHIKMYATRYYLALVLLLSFIIISFFVLFYVDASAPIQVLSLPVSTFSALMVLLYGPVALRFIPYFCGILFIAVRFDPPSCIYLAFASLTTVAIMRLAKTRFKLLSCSLLQGIMQMLILEFVFLVFPSYGEKNLTIWGFVFISGFLGILAVSGFLPIFEYFTKIPTNFSLLELSNLNAPVLRKMQSIAPGTYNHSLNLATLSESACLTIGANGLLARVASYYHDIGKIENPEYFVENQEGENKHNVLKPEVSAMIIRNHVKNGLDMAKKLRLPAEIVNIIDEHHGAGCVTYFYEQAKHQHKENNEDPPNKADFLYTGHWPKTLESAIVSLADSVEAASHTMSHRDIPSLREQVWSIIVSKMSEGVLQHCCLTIENLYKIVEVFVLTLAGQYHTRIAYPNKTADPVESEGPKE